MLRSGSDFDISAASKGAFVDPGDAASTPTTTGGSAAPPPPPSSPGRGGSLSTASGSPASVSCPPSPPLPSEQRLPQSRRFLHSTTAATTIDSAATPPPPPIPGLVAGLSSTTGFSARSTALEPVVVATGHDKAAADTREEEAVGASVMDQTTVADAFTMAMLSDSTKQNQWEEELVRREGEVNQWEPKEELDRKEEEENLRDEEVERKEQDMRQREEAAMQRDKQQYDRWLRLAEWEADLRQMHYAVLQGHAKLSKWVKEAEVDWTDRVTRVRRMEDDVRWKNLRIKAKEEEEEEQQRTHGCFGSGFLHWNYGRRTAASDEAWASLKHRLLMPQQSKPMPIPSDTPNPIVADTTATTMGTLMATPKAKVYHDGTHFMAPRIERPTTYDVPARPGLVESTSESKDLQMVKIGLCVLTRPGENFNERILPSIIHETLK